MKELLRIRGGKPLSGHVSVSGSKNASVAIIPAALLASSPSVIENLPDIEDVYVLIAMLRALGAKVEFKDGVMTVDPSGLNRSDPPADLAAKMRASYYLCPVLAGKLGEAHLHMPGGCAIGSRPIDQTLKGMRALGISVEQNGDMLDAVRTESFNGNQIVLDMPSVGATINAMLAAVSAPGETQIFNAAKEPHIVDTANFLVAMGGWVKGAGTDIIRVRGGRPLHGTNYTVIPDQIETGTLMIAAAATRGDVFVHGTIPTHMESLSAKLLEMGVYVSSEDDVIRVRAMDKLRPIKVETRAYPGFPTDLQQPLTALLTTAWGTSTVIENLYESRFKYVYELKNMGADITLVNERRAVITGVEKLTPTTIKATDLRAGAAMIVAALMTEGDTYIDNVQYIMRGYEHIDSKLRQLGADAEYIEVNE